MLMQQNYDPQELAKFAASAHQWWDTTGEMRMLHALNPIRLDYIMQKAPLDGLKVLDVGCGGGILSESLAQHKATVTGIDMNKSLISVAKLHLHESKLSIEYLHTSTESFAIERPEQFDVITCLELLEHVPDPAAIVSACAKLVKPGGKLFFSTLNRTVKSYLLAILGAEYVLQLLPKNTHDYSKFIRPAELHAWCKQAKLLPKETKGIHYNPLSKNFSLTNNIDVNYLFYAEKPNE